MKHVIVNRELRKSIPHEHMIWISKASELSGIDLDALILSYANMHKYQKKEYIRELSKELKAYND